MLGRALGALGFSVLVAHDGHEALALADAHAGPIRLLVTDVEMPGLTGVELAHALGTTRPELPVLFVSGHVGPGALAEAVRDRPASYLAKPFSVDALRRVDRVLLASEPYPFAEAHRDVLLRHGFRADQLMLVDGELLSWHGVRLIEGLPYAARLIDATA